MYQALYRKWRPKTFDEVVGQEHITETLKNQITSGRLSHAYLFIGTRGTGKTTCAKILAKALNCENPQNGNPCGKCPACRGIEEGSILDVVEIDAASNNKVEHVRALREEAVFSPVSVKKRVYIIDEVHMLTTSAFNALLKILEEPPQHLTFILATTELNKVPSTILSRCQRHSFRRLSPDSIADHLTDIAGREGMILEPDAAKLIAGLAEGGMRDAISLLDQCSGVDRIDVDAVYSSMGLTGNRRISMIMDFTIKHNAEEAVNMFAELWRDGKDPCTFLGELNTLQRDCLMLQISPKVRSNLLSGGYTAELLSALNRRLTKAELISRIDTVSSYLSKAKDAPSSRLIAELCLISLCDPSLTEDTAALRGRVSALEARLASIEAGSVKIQTVSEPSDSEEEDEEDEAPFPEIPEDIAPPPGFLREDEPCDDGLDPAQFAEYQPEDDMPKAKDEPAMINPDASAESDNAPTDSAELWQRIVEKAEEELSPLAAAAIGSAQQVRGEVSFDTLDIYAARGMTYNLINNQDIIIRLRSAATFVTGRSLRVNVHEADPSDSAPKRSLDEIKKHKETRLI
ncbi:MAG: DNA polymerase III subunit gamma/tau [Oscillospiraceae bacterium]|nr:DNA polymerase III subunit gamma/tau [Oscillospiraceae bacterium]